MGAWLNLCLLGLKLGMVKLYVCIDVLGGFPDSNMIDTNNLSIKNYTYRLINVLHGANLDFFLNLCLLGLEFGMVRLDACIYGVGGFPYSNMADTNNLNIKNNMYRLINVLHGANVEIC